MNKIEYRLTLIAGIFALIAVILGALGAHALESKLAINETTDAWQTAVDYQMWHALAILALAASPSWGSNAKARKRVIICFGLGILLFSGSIYWLALGGPRWLGPITPIGGLMLVAGWGTLILECLRRHESD